MTPEQLFAATIVLIVGVAWIASVLDERRIRRRAERRAAAFRADHATRFQPLGRGVSTPKSPGRDLDQPRGGANALSAGTGRADSSLRPRPSFPSTPTTTKRNRRR